MSSLAQSLKTITSMRGSKASKGNFYEKNFRKTYYRSRGDARRYCLFCDRPLLQFKP